MEDKRRVGQYILERKIGEGGMAEVWEATQMPMESKWAVKFLLPKLAGDPELETRFLNEAKRQGGLRHPNIVAATHFFQEGGRSYLVMDYVEGINLEDRLKMGTGPLSVNDVLRISESVLDALGYAHAMGYVHRDVKPSNILIDFTKGRVYLSDFGIALAMNEDNRLTKTGTAVGTPDYMSPEQITAASPVDTRSDIYSFGCVLYAMLTGAPPFSHAGASDFGVKQGHVYEQAPAIRARNPNVTPEVEKVVEKCMAKAPGDRYQSCAEVLAALRNAVNPPPPPPPPVPVRPDLVQYCEHVPADESVHAQGRKPIKNLLMLVIVACLLAAAGLVGYMWYTSSAIATGPVPVVMRLEGSTTIGDDLAANLVEAWLKQYGAKDIKRTMELNAKNQRTFHIRAILPGKSKPEEIKIFANGSKEAFVALKGNTADIGMASRRINEGEIASLAKTADGNDAQFPNITAPNQEIVVGLDGIAIVVNEGNTVSQLTKQQVALIFSGKVTNWKELGGADAPIALFGRDTASGTFKTFLEDVLNNNTEAYLKNIVVKANGDDIAKAVAQNPGGVGYVSLAQVKRVKALALSDGANTQALLPTYLTVALEDYILSRRLYFYTNKPMDELVYEFLKFAKSDKGQTVVEQTGFAKQSGDFEPTVDIPDSAPADYKSITSGRRRMTINFRFDSKSDTPDNKANDDVVRAIQGIKDAGAHDVYLLGFADSVGGYEQNLPLSESRAAQIAKLFEQQHIHVTTAGFSNHMPLAVDTEPDGKKIPAALKKNRRVELWAKVK